LTRVGPRRIRYHRHAGIARGHGTDLASNRDSAPCRHVSRPTESRMMPSASRKPFPLRRALVALATLASVSAAPPALAEAVAGLRVMLHPNTAPRGTLPAATLANLERVAGASFTLIGATRTGALELGLAGPIDEVG